MENSFSTKEVIGGALAQEVPGEIKPPSLALLALELRAILEFGAFYMSMPLLGQAPRGDGHPVLVLPGFISGDWMTYPLRSFLAGRGYAAYGWEMGVNWGDAEILEEKLLLKLRQIHEDHQEPVSMVGWSLGGIYARELARLDPERVRFVITLGSPFSGSPKANRMWRLFEYITRKKLDEVPPDTIERLKTPPPVPTTSVFSRSDGIAAWQCCVEWAESHTEHIEVKSSHSGLCYNPTVLWLVAERLSQPEEKWRPFEREGMKSWLYPLFLRESK